MRPSIAIAIAAALAFGTASFGSAVSAAELSKDELIQKLLHGKHARKIVAGTASAAPGQAQMMVIDPGAVKRKGPPLRQELVVMPQPVITNPGTKTKMMIVKPMIIQPAKTQMIAEPMIVAPGGGIKTKPFKSQPVIAKMVVQPQQIIAEPTPDDFRKMSQRKIVVEERKELAAIVQQNDLPTVDMEVYFSYDSSAIEPEAFRSLIALGQALSDPRLKGGTFLIAGHTDGTGSPGYNQGLSERRAYAIKGFLVQNFHLDPQSLLAVGYGEEQLKDYADPTSGVNRRVQVANLSS
jgi:outer membrane protein OmpA-like peptidoglycan-associated protein